MPFEIHNQSSRDDRELENDRKDFIIRKFIFGRKPPQNLYLVSKTASKLH